MATKQDMTWDQAILKVLGDSEGAMSCKEIAEKIASDALRENLGATPAKTVSATISRSIKKKDTPYLCLYIEGAEGFYTLKEKILCNNSHSHSEEEDEIESQYGVITAFGMFWRREEIEWTATPKLLGMQQIGATPVDFCKQFGIYLLYDGREVIYVGRSTDRPLGKRLYEHTIDRLSARWDRFSWFGLLPVSDDGQIGLLPDNYKADSLIPAMEAILIEALEPRQNRKRGDDLAAVEYLQKVDPEIEKKRIKATLDAALNKL